MKHKITLTKEIEFESDSMNKSEILDEFINELRKDSKGTNAIYCDVRDAEFSVEEGNVEFTQAQIDQIDNIENSVHELCKIMLNDSNLNWDMNMIGDVADVVAETLAFKGLKVYYPAIVTDENGNEKIINFYSEDKNK